MPGISAVPILDELALAGLTYGANYLVEFDPHSFWYETSLTIAAHALSRGIRTDYHTFMHIPGEVRKALTTLGLELNSLEKAGTFRMLDNYSVTTGLIDPDEIRKQSSPRRLGGITSSSAMILSVNLKDWAADEISEMREGSPEIEKKRLHLDDNTSVMVGYNDERSFIDHWRTHEIPWSRGSKTAAFHSVVTGVYSEAFYRQFESLCDEILDFRSLEEHGIIEQYARVRSMRQKAQDSRWRRLRLLENGAVKVDESSPKIRELGISGWLKGPKK